MSNGKISDLFFEVGYKINPTGMKKMGIVKVSFLIEKKANF